MREFDGVAHDRGEPVVEGVTDMGTTPEVRSDLFIRDRLAAIVSVRNCDLDAIRDRERESGRQVGELFGETDVDDLVIRVGRAVVRAAVDHRRERVRP